MEIIIQDLFIPKPFHPPTFFIQKSFIQKWFHPKTVSSKNRFIRKRLHPKTVSTTKQFHPKTTSSKNRFIQNFSSFNLGRFPLTPSPLPDPLPLDSLALDRPRFRSCFPSPVPFSLFSLSRWRRGRGGSSRGFVATGHGHGPPKLCVWASLRSFCVSPGGPKAFELLR